MPSEPKKPGDLLVHRFLTAVVVIGILPLSGTAALGQQPFDGRWNIQAIPEKGACKRAQRFAVIIQNGTIRNGGSRRVHVTGGLDPSGSVRGSVVRNKTRVNVTGRLQAGAGSGEWDTAGRVTCSGRWTAEKRS
jgi:hypothetical protein